MNDFSNVRIGTSGYVFDDWAGSFYPPKLSRKDWLKFYASQFQIVEINATYYRIPPAKTMESMSNKTPLDFNFIIKANREMTHEVTRNPSVYRAFSQAVEPIKERGQLRGVLFQFPYGYKCTHQNQEHLRFLSDYFSQEQTWVEFRHMSWNRPETFDYLRSIGLGFCVVDEPSLPGLMPGISTATTPCGYVRFHGRNDEHWWNGGHRRYDWEYSTQELETWLERIRDLSQATSTTYVFFNNCYMGRAVKGARLLQKLLGQTVPLELEF